MIEQKQMDVTKIDFSQIPQLSGNDKAYTLEDAAMRPFYEHEVSIEQFKAVIEKKTFSAEKRQLLADALEVQYEGIKYSSSTWNNIQKLRAENSYTIITAHQPNLFTGPLYSIYKIVSTLNLVEQLEATYPEHQFVPIFWTGGEDHDFEEVNHLNLFGRKIVWEDPQGGPVGAYDAASLQPTLEEVIEVLGQGEFAQTLAAALRRFYTDAPNYSAAVKKFVNWIFSRYGLVIANANNAVFKRQMISIFKDELLNQTSKPIVEASAAAFEAAGFKKQAHARDINLFYLSPNRRDRIVKEGPVYKVLDTNIAFSQAEILEELEQHPERFSPNVILRPLFQETIFPNLAYIGGGGELAYWLERKTQFEHYQLPFPMLIRRCSVLWIDKNQAKKMKKLGLDNLQLFTPTEALLKEFVLKNTTAELSFADEKAALETVYQQVLNKTEQVDASMEKGVLAQQAQALKALDKLEQRLIRAEKKKNETSLEQIRKLKEKLFPKNGLQERHDNFLAFYSRYGDVFLETLKANLNPLDKKFVVIQD